MSQCGLLSGPAAADLIENQLATVSAKGDQAYQLALSAISDLRKALIGDAEPVGAGTIGGPWFVPNPQYSTPVDKTRVFDKPDIANRTIASFSMPDDPKNVLGGLNDLDGVLNDILAELQTLIAGMPTFGGVTITDQYLLLFYTEYNRLAGQLETVLAACPPVALLCDTLTAWMQDGAVGMPAGVEDAIRNRAFAAEDKQAFQAEGRRNRTRHAQVRHRKDDGVRANADGSIFEVARTGAHGSRRMAGQPHQDSVGEGGSLQGSDRSVRRRRAGAGRHGERHRHPDRSQAERAGRLYPHF